MLNVNFDPFPEIQTARLLLRRMQPEDAPALFALRSNPQMMRFIARPIAESVDDALALIQKVNDEINANNGINWAVSLKTDQELIGLISFWRIEKEHHRAEIGYMLAPGEQGKGIMNEALQGLLNFGFNTLGLHSVEAHINPSNAQSIGVVEKAGFVREAHFRENILFNGEFRDTVIYSLRATMPRPVNAKG